MVEREFECRGFVLCGGRSRRMNPAGDEAGDAANDKALLPFGGRPLVVHMAERVKSVCGNATLVGPRVRYAHLGLPIVEDLYPGAGPGVGPLGGLHAALSNSHGAWSLVAACDMPNLTCEFLQLLAGIARNSSADAVVPAAGPSGFEPLCGLYSAACLPDVESELRAGHYKLLRFLEALQGQGRLRLVTHEEWLPYDAQGRLFWNLNTPEKYQQAQKAVEGVSGKVRA